MNSDEPTPPASIAAPARCRPWSAELCSSAGEEDPGASFDDLPQAARERLVGAPPRRSWRGFALRAGAAGLLAGVLSGLALLRRRRGGIDYGGLNAPSHWFWGRRALHRDGRSVEYTLTGAATHLASSVFWAACYEALQRRRRTPRAAGAIADAAAVAAAAAVVDLRLVPERLTPGFERRLAPPRLAAVYLLFGAGLAVAGLLALRRQP